VADIAPLRAACYSAEAGPLNTLVAPPYDVISPEEQERLYDLSPYNVVRLILHPERPSDDEERNRYTRAAQHLREWLNLGVLRRDPTPALYVYEQEFEWARRPMHRRGVLCIVRLEELGQGSVFPHENTLAGPKADRLKLMTACRGCLSPVFALYPDEDQSATAALQEVADNATRAEEKTRVVHDLSRLSRLIAVTDPQAIARLQGLIAPRPLFIADGHHRYETALAYREQCTREHGAAGAADYVLMMCVSMADPGLLILPTHRVVRGVEGLSPERLEADAAECFEVEKISVADVPLEPEGMGRHRLVVYFGRDRTCLSLRLRDPSKALRPGSTMSRTWHELDVNILHEFVFGDILGLDVDALAQGPDIAYAHDTREAMRLVDEDSWAAAFLMEPTQLHELERVASAGERMPPKSTYFYPKLLSGLALYLFDDDG